MEPFYSSFEAADTADWKQRLQQDLKGISFEELSTTDRNGLTIFPFYHIDEAREAAPTFEDPDWTIMSKIVVQDAELAKSIAEVDLNGGASGLHFVLTDLIDFETLLSDISVEHIVLQFTLKANGAQHFAAWQAYLQQHQLDPKALRVFFVTDYLKTAVAADGAIEEPAAITIIEQTQSIYIDGGIYQESGACSTYEIACILAQLNEYLHQLHSKVDIKHLHIGIATDTLFFEQIAKLRSLRKTLPLILNQYDCKAQVHLHASNSNTYRSEYDSYSNLLRDTLAGMAAIIGGADSLYIPPFDLKKLSDNEFSRRLSLNQQLIFKEESYLNKVADSSTGSYAIEQLTHDIAEKSWKLFQQIEEEGGFLVSGNKGKIQATIQQQAQELVEAYRSGKKILVGVNKFPDPMDQPQEKRANPQRTSGLTALNLADALLYKH